MLLRSPPKISLASLPTPLRKLSRLSEKLGGPNIWIKEDYLTGFAMSGNKVRKLEYLLADAQTRGASDIITCGGIQSNHCRATAFACAQLGLSCHLILREDEGYKGLSSRGEANHFLDMLAGAQIHIHSAQKYQASLPQLFADLEQKICERGGQAYSIPTGGSNGLGVWGYLDCVKELKEQCDAIALQPDMLACASGSGGTQAGLSLGVHIHNMSSSVLGFAVCDSSAYFNRKVKADINECCERASMSAQQTADLIDALSIETNDKYIGPGYAKTQVEVYDFIAELAALEGVLLDPVYTGKAFYGMLCELKSARFEGVNDIVFIHTGGGFGLFSHAAHYTENDAKRD